jgi:hypothetical protein
MKRGRTLKACPEVKDPGSLSEQWRHDIGRRTGNHAHYYCW